LEDFSLLEVLKVHGLIPNLEGHLVLKTMTIKLPPPRKVWNLVLESFNFKI
jgi:hypothetical protein